MRTVNIYALRHPQTAEIRYVGWCYDLKARLRAHISKSQLVEDTHKARWIRLLLQKGLRPEIILLELTNSENRAERECYWIERLRSEGAWLTNSAEGGPGCSGFKHSPKTIEQFSSKLRGKPKSPEHCLAISKAHVGLKASMETREKMRLAHLGKKQSPAAIAKTAAAHRGKIRSETTRARLRFSWEQRRRKTLLIAEYLRRKKP